ncbi:hypothetical protein [Janthinobacterium sp. LB3P118]|uniref:hypothetical protein n=1 Tax=Janthinobacterium sp. LB3P118 TaxID=3424195 RepID=UPI003F25ACB6
MSRLTRQALPAIAARDLQGQLDPVMLESVFAVLTLAKGNLRLSALLLQMDSSEVDEWLEERLGWSEVYGKDA